MMGKRTPVRVRGRDWPAEERDVQGDNAGKALILKTDRGNDAVSS